MPSKRRGVCTVCRRNVAVTWETGLVWPHHHEGVRCKGTGHPPVEDVH